MAALEHIAEAAVEQYAGRVAQEFESLEAFAFHLVAAAVAMKVAKKHALREATKVICADARKQIGEYQEAVGEYPAWEPLAESTEDEKARLGAPPDAPLLRYGDLQKSFRGEVINDNEAIAGSTDPVMNYHELGTSKMPPRPVLGPAYVKNEKKIQKILGVAVVDAILSGQHLGYRLSGGPSGSGD